jgi:tRNA/rRNA methyltransferase/tRNA (cytidine32/uridine32-2'-O)-methyltransferase
MYLSDIAIILCRPEEAGNIGATCRAMKNMGLSELRIADSKQINENSLLNRAIHAADIWENAKFYENLAEAGADCSILVGTTRRRGRKRKSVSMDPRTLAAWLNDRPGLGKVGIVFGNERTGLEEAELDLCNIASHIPVSDAFPSLNLSHAVQLYAYEFFLALSTENSVKGQWNAMKMTEVNELVDSISNALESIGFYKHPGREVQENFLRDIIARAGLTGKEGRYFKDIIVKAGRLSIT